MAKPQKRYTEALHNPFIAITVMILVVYLVGVAFILFTRRHQGRLPITSLPTAANWLTYTNTTEGYAFKYMPMFNGPATIRDDLVEIYEEVEGLVILINMIQTSQSPTAWIATQKADGYTSKPFTCFSLREVTDIPSATASGISLLHFATPVLFLDNVASPEGKKGSCSNYPTARVILIPRDRKLLKITFSGTPVSEQMVSTFHFLK